MNYRQPQDVNTPKNLVKVVGIIYNGGENSYSLAKLVWGETEVIGIRWNSTHRERENKKKLNGEIECIGSPNSRGYPTWFILPKELFEEDIHIDKIKEYLTNKSK